MDSFCTAGSLFIAERIDGKVHTVAPRVNFDMRDARLKPVT